MDIDERNKKLCDLYKSGIPMTKISKDYNISCTQLSRIFKFYNVKRKKFELDKDYFENNKDKTLRQISEKNNISIKRVQHLYRIAYNKKMTKGTVNFSGNDPIVNPNLINNKEWIFNKYCINKLGTPSIAKLLATKSYLVIKKLKEFDIKLRGYDDSNAKNRPSKDWLIENYVNKRYSISKCAKIFKSGFDTIYSALRDYNLEIRNASEQHIGDLNEFYGKFHPIEIKNKCAEIGSYYGSRYWTEGDVDLKIKLVSEISKKIWSDSNKRSEASLRIAKLCSVGGCNSKHTTFICKDGNILLLRSSWEESVAKLLDDCGIVKEWKYEHILIEYLDDDVIRNFVVDFYVEWIDGMKTLIECKNKHLLSQDKEKLKIESLHKYCNINNYKYIVISDKKDIVNINNGYKSKVKWINNNLYEVPISVCDDNELFRELAIHEIINKISPWSDIEYTDNVLSNDLNNLINENLNGYINNDFIKSTASNSNGMPGRKIMTHFNKHFYRVPLKNRESIHKAFDNKDILYKCINISIKERESLSLERLLREINFHYTKYGRASYFAPGLARVIYKKFNVSGKTIFDPCGGWGGRLLGAWLEKCKYIACELSDLSFNGLINISKFVNFECEINNISCLDFEWPKSDLIFTSPPYFNTEMYIGGDQPWKKFKSNDQWINGFVKPFISKINSLCILYVDCYIKDDFEKIRKFDDVIIISNKKHPRSHGNCEFLCIYNYK